MYFGTAQTVFSEPKRRLANRLMLVSGGLGELLSGLLTLQGCASQSNIKMKKYAHVPIQPRPNFFSKSRIEIRSCVGLPCGQLLARSMRSRFAHFDFAQRVPRLDRCLARHHVEHLVEQRLRGELRALVLDEFEHVVHERPRVHALVEQETRERVDRDRTRAQHYIGTPVEGHKEQMEEGWEQLFDRAFKTYVEK